MEFCYLNFYHNIIYSLDYISHSMHTQTTSSTGLLAPVTNLTLHYEANISFLSWVPPFSLDGLDIGYNITLSNSSHAYSFSPSNVNGFNISTRGFLSPCSTYMFTVQPWNEVGVSSPSYLTKFFPGGKST